MPFSMNIPHFDMLTSPIPNLRLAFKRPLLWKVDSRGRIFLFQSQLQGVQTGEFLPLNLIFPTCQVNSNNIYLEDGLGLNGIKQEMACQSICDNPSCVWVVVHCRHLLTEDRLHGSPFPISVLGFLSQHSARFLTAAEGWWISPNLPFQNRLKWYSGIGICDSVFLWRI